MKRKFHLLLVLGLSCSFFGCVGTFSSGSITDNTTVENSAKYSSESNILSENDAESDADEPQDVKRGVSAESGNAATANATASWSLENPPALIVSTEYEADSVTAEIYGYTWTKKLDEDQMATTIACGMHPLDDPGESGYAILYTAFPPGSLPPLPEGQYPGFMLPVFYLDFGEIPPETVTARRWPAEYVGSASEHYNDAEEVQVDMSERSLFPLGDGKFVYEVHADWGEVGSADYVFITLPQVRGGS